MTEGWPLILLTIGIAAAATLVALPVRCAGRGHLFASRASTALTALCALAVIVLSAGAALLTMLLPGGDTPARPLAVAFLLPFGMCAARVGRRYIVRSQQAAGPATVTKLVSAGGAILLDKLDTQMALDRDEWVIGDGWDDLAPEAILPEAQDLADTLTRLVGERDGTRAREIRRHLQAVQRAVEAAADAGTDEDEIEKQLNRAQQALLFLRGHAYDWGYHRHRQIDRSPAPSSADA